MSAKKSLLSQTIFEHAMSDEDEERYKGGYEAKVRTGNLKGFGNIDAVDVLVATGHLNAVKGLV